MRQWTGLLLLLVAVTAVWAADEVVVENWSEQPIGHRGVPDGWKAQDWGSPQYGFTIEDNEGHRVLHMKSAGDSSTITRDIKGKVNLRETPILEWSWRVVTLPTGADSRKKETDDQAGQIYVVWPRFPEALRSRIIGYVWDSTAPVGTIVKSGKTGTVTYVVVRSGPAELHRWITERRNVAEDFKNIYGEKLDNPAALSVGIDSNDTNSTAESFMGPIVFKTR